MYCKVYIVQKNCGCAAQKFPLCSCMFLCSCVIRVIYINSGDRRRWRRLSIGINSYMIGWLNKAKEEQNDLDDSKLRVK